MKPPTFFLSSTIYDFKDLRSAIKHHLEQQGCRVLASEFNDFRKPLDKHSYEACLHAIQEADWFVLLIGSRVGGWYDETAKVSITQQEYREAYRLHQQGRLKLLTFVRAEVWQTREDRKQLARHLDGLGVDLTQKAKIVNYPSKSAEDAEFISAFINEVGRNAETRAARANGGNLPTGNWVHVFETFRDVVDAIQLQPFAGRPVEDTALRRLLRLELREILRSSLVKTSRERAFSPRSAVDRFHAAHTLPTPPRYQGRYTVNVDTFDPLGSLSISLLGMRHNPRILGRAIESSAFLRLDNVSGGFAEEPVYAGLLRLAEELRSFEMANKSESVNVILQNTPRARPRHSNHLDVDAMQLFMFLHLMDRWCNVIALCKAVLLHLDGAEFVLPDLRPRSPASNEEERFANEEATQTDIDLFLAR